MCVLTGVFIPLSCKHEPEMKRMKINYFVHEFSDLVLGEQGRAPSPSLTFKVYVGRAEIVLSSQTQIYR